MKKMKIHSINNNEINLPNTLEYVQDLAIKSAKLLIKKQKSISKLTITSKEAQGVASEADVESEKIIIKGILKKFPDHFILAEESAFKEFKGEKSRYQFLKEKEWVWLIDPLDGTNNYLAGMDYYAICISLVHFGRPVLGLVLRPNTGECFYAIEGKGAFKFIYTDNFSVQTKKQKIIASPVNKKLKDSLVVTGFVTEKGEHFEQEFNFFKFMMTQTRGIRRMGSAALDICYVATGVFQCFWERGLSPWDVSASGIICQESGIVVSDFYNQEFHPFQETIICARKSIHREMLSLFQQRL